MVTHLRSLSNKICCGHYMKAVNRIPIEKNALYFRKPIRCTALAEANTAFASAPGRNLTVPPSICNHENAFQPQTSLSFCLNKSLQDPLLFFNGKDSVMLSSNFGSDFHKDLISLPGANHNKSDSDSSSAGLPTPEQLEVIHKYFSEALPRLFQKPLDHNIFYKDVILENNIRKTRHVGLGKYMYQLALLKAFAHFKFAYVRFQVLKMTNHPETGTIKCRWRIVGISGTAVIFQFWKFPITKLRKIYEETPAWYDGFSTYYVGADGLIHKHVIDKMMPDDDHVPIDKTITPKVALFLGLVPEPEQGAFIKFTNKFKNRASLLASTILPQKKLDPLT